MTDKYIVIAEKDISRFVSRCNHEMGNGYVPQGGMLKTDYEFFQAFTLAAKPGRPPTKKTTVKRGTE